MDGARARRLLGHFGFGADLGPEHVEQRIEFVFERCPCLAILGGNRFAGDADAARMQFFGNGQIVERDRRRGLKLSALGSDEQVVEKRGEVAIDLCTHANCSVPGG